MNVMRISEYLENEWSHIKNDELIYSLENIIKDVRERTILECVELLDEYGIDDQGILGNEIKLGYIK